MKQAKKQAPRGAWDDLAEEKLKTSGLTRDDAVKLGIEYLPREKTAALWPRAKPLRALCLNYFDHEGKALSDWPKAPPFKRVRYLEESTGPEALTTKKQPRYAQAPGTAPCAYLPRNQEWGPLLKDTSRPLILTEGEFKAAKACKEGFPTIGLGGVYNWRALKMGIAWLPSLDPFVWLRRAVYLCFDSDVRSNPMVLTALKELADELQARGAIVFFAVLPELEGLKKVGIDDFLVRAGTSAKEQFKGVLHTAQPLGLATALWELNTRYTYVRSPGLVLNTQTLGKISPNAFKEHAESTRSAFEMVARPEGVEPVAASASAAWLRWPCRSEAARITYAPGQPQLLEDGSFNEWAGWGYEPKKGDVKPFLTLLKNLFQGAESGAYEWFLQWCAYPIQNPGAKLYTASVFQGVTHGTGKSFVGYLLGRVYGDGMHGNTRAKNYVEVESKDLHGSFNEWAQGKQFVLGDEVTGKDKRAESDYFKNLITRREIRINAKYVPTYTVPDTVNYFLTANHPDAFFLEDTDRRFFVHEVTAQALSGAFYKDLERFMDSDAGPAALHYFFREQVDCSKFNPSAPALRTSAKERMTANGLSDLAAWVRSAVTQPDAVLKFGDVALLKDLFSAGELLALYDPERRTGTTAGGMGRELARAGIRLACDGALAPTPGGKLERLYAIRNPGKWATAKSSEIQKHLAEFALASADPTPKKPKY